jgi:hypothetical protein
MLARQIILPRPLATQLTPLLRYSYKLFFALKKSTPLESSKSELFLQNTRGGGIGIPDATAGHPRWGSVLQAPCPREPRATSPNSFPCHTYKKSAPKSFRCHTYKNALRNSFPCHTSEKLGVSPQLRLTRILVSDPFGASVSLWPKTPSLSNFPTFRPPAHFQLECL